MKGLFGGLLYTYEYIGFLFRTVLLFSVKILLLIIGLLLFLLIGRKEIFIYAKKMDILSLPFKLDKYERVLNGIILSTAMSLFLITQQAYYHNTSNINANIHDILNFIFAFFIPQIPYFSLAFIREILEEIK